MDPDLRALYDRYYGILRQKCARMLPDTGEAEDVAQETFVRLWQSSARFQRPEQVVSWLYRTSTRLAVDRLRRLKVRGGGEAPNVIAEPITGSPEVEAHARAVWVQLSRRLSAGDLELALLAYVDRMSQPEIAEVMGSSERTIRRRIAKLNARLARLRQELDR